MAGATLATLRAGHQAPNKVAAVPKAIKPTTAPTLAHSCSTGSRLASMPPPKSPLSTCSAKLAKPMANNTPSRLPTKPSTQASANTNAMRMRGVQPNTPSNANCGKRLATLSDNTEKTKKAPVNKATNASTLKFTR